MYVVSNGNISFDSIYNQPGPSFYFCQRLHLSLVTWILSNIDLQEPMILANKVALQILFCIELFALVFAWTLIRPWTI